MGTRDRWSLMLVVVPAACALGAAYAAGSHSTSQGLAAYFTRESLAARFSQALAAPLQKEAIAAALERAHMVGETTPIMSKAGDPVDRWPIVSTLAGVVASDGARGRLAALLASSITLDQMSTATKGENNRPSDPQEPLSELGLAKATVASRVREWLDVELPDLAVEGAFISNGATPPSPGTGARIRDHCSELLSGAVVVAALLETMRADLDTTSLDAALAPLAVRDFGARAAWSVSATIFASLAFASIILGYQWCRASSRAWARRALTTGMMVGTAVLVMPFIGWNLRPPLLAGPFGRYTTLYGLRIEEATVVLNVVAAVAIVLLLASAWSGLATPSTGDQLRQHLESLRGSMNLATALLVSGVFEIYAVSRLAGSFAATEAGRAASESAAMSAAAAIGLLFSTTLVLLYVPGVAALKKAGGRLVTETKVTQAELETMLTGAGLSDSGWALFQRVAQVLLPLAVSAPIAGLAEILAR